jgi:hypothetical protein
MRVGSRFARYGLTGSRGWKACALLAVAISITGCHRKVGTEGAPATGQKTFASPAEAGSALANAARSNDEPQMLAIFVPDSKSILFSGDAVEDKTELANFAAAYDRLNRWRKLENGSQILLVGPTNTAFPVPLRPTHGGQWYFDTPAGVTELQARRIGRNELAIIDVIASLADAQEEYYTQAHDGSAKQFARRFISDPGTQNGLYWPPVAGQPKSPVGPVVAYATEQGAKLQPNLHKPFHGYYFGILDTQGYYANGGLRDYIRGGVMNRGFGFIAWPAEYGKSGTMTFMINRDRIIFQKDMGKTTKDQAPFMTAFNPDYTGWQRVEQ